MSILPSSCLIYHKDKGDAVSVNHSLGMHMKVDECSKCTSTIHKSSGSWDTFPCCKCEVICGTMSSIPMS